MVADGYKDTEIGVIPIEWDVVNFKNFFSSVGAKKYQVQKSNYLKSGSYPIIDQGQKFIVGYSDEDDKVYKNTNGVVVFGDHTRIIKFIDFDFVVGADGTQLLKSIDGINQKFSYYVLSNKELTNLGYSRHFKLVKEMKFPLPPLKEQEKIADILSTADDKIDAIAIQIEKAETLKKGLLQKLLSEGIGHSVFKDSELGKIPENWEVVEQKTVATFYNGRAYKLTEWEEEGTPVIRLQNLTGSGKDYYYSNMKLPEHQYCSYGDLLYMWSATFGPVWWYGEKAIYHYHIWKISTDERSLNKDFLYYLLYRITIRMKNEAHGSTMIHVTKGGMEKLKIQLPPLEEQKQIADILSTTDEKLEVLRAKKQMYETLKKGLLQKLLSGEVRV